MGKPIAKKKGVGAMPTLNWIGKKSEALDRHDRWLSAQDDRLIGGLWANLSGGRCRFIMVKEKRWELIDALLG